MVIYVPVFRNEKWDFEIIETQKARYIKKPGHDAFVIYFGTIYNGEYLFTKKEGVTAYWNKTHNLMGQYRIKADSPVIKWRNNK